MREPTLKELLASVGVEVRRLETRGVALYDKTTGERLHKTLRASLEDGWEIYEWLAVQDRQPETWYNAEEQLLYLVGTAYKGLSSMYKGKPFVKLDWKMYRVASTLRPLCEIRYAEQPDETGTWFTKEQIEQAREYFYD